MPNDALAIPVTESRLADILESLETVKSNVFSVMQSDRARNDNSRLNLWDGQSSDGLKHADNNGGNEPDPFDGSADARMRMADQYINEDMMLFMVAMQRARIRIEGSGEGGSIKGGKMALLLRHMVKNMMGMEWDRELMKVAQFMLADSPAVALLATNWKREMAMVRKSITVDELAQFYQTTVDPNTDPAVAQSVVDQFRAMIVGDGGGDDAGAVAWIMQMFPWLRKKRATAMLKQLRETQKCDFPVPVVKYEGPTVEGLRILEDFIVPGNAMSFQKCPYYFTFPWMTRAQGLEIAATEQWSDEFTKAVFGEKDKDGKWVGGHEGVAYFPDWTKQGYEYSPSPSDSEWFKGMFQVIRVFWEEPDEDGVPGKYYTVVHPDVKELAAHDLKLIEYDHGQWPGTMFLREVLSKRMLDARGITELVSSDEGVAKQLFDYGVNNAIVAALPPISYSGTDGNREPALGPLSMVRINAGRGELKFTTPPAYPQTALEILKQIKVRLDAYHGRPNDDVPPEITALVRQYKVWWWLVHVRNVYVQLLSLAQQFMTPEMLESVRTRDGSQVFAGPQDLAGDYRVFLECNPADWDTESIQKKIDMISALAGLDRDNTMVMGTIIRSLMWWLAPEMSEDGLQSDQEGQQNEIEDELKAYGKICNGVEPDLKDDGSINYAVRRQVYTNIEKANPDVYRNMPPDRIAMLQSRIERLDALNQQFGANKQIGRQGGKTAGQSQASGGQQPPAPAGGGQ